MQEDNLIERLNILRTALKEFYRKKKQIDKEIDELKGIFSSAVADGCTNEDKAGFEIALRYETFHQAECQKAITEAEKWLEELKDQLKQ